MTIVEFLRARLDEDKRVAHESNDHPSAGDFSLYVVDDDYKYDTICISAGRVLAEVAAKRRIIELHTPVGDDPGGPDYCNECERYDATGTVCPTLRLLALPYASHEAYRPEWVL